MFFTIPERTAELYYFVFRPSRVLVHTCLPSGFLRGEKGKEEQEGHLPCQPRRPSVAYPPQLELLYLRSTFVSTHTRITAGLVASGLRVGACTKAH
jgi:hypothetical protein